jgi:hypothetical protein
MLDKKQTFGVVIFTLLLGSALVGMAAPIGLHPEATDQLDNDGDMAADWLGTAQYPPDPDLIAYPYADGSGESPTDPASMWTGESYATLYEMFVELYNSDPAYYDSIGACSPGTIDQIINGIAPGYPHDANDDAFNLYGFCGLGV